MARHGYLSEIVESHRARARADRRNPEELRQAAAAAPPPRQFAASLRTSAAQGLAVVAEIKRRSPSKGDLDPRLDPAALAHEYAEGGATCLSVLTDTDFFGGSAEDLVVARGACGLPVLRKDFTVCAADVCDARIMGADALLLIAAALDDEELQRLHALATELGMDALVEVHDRSELRRALAVGASLVGVNQRDLRSFTVDHDRAVGLAAAIPTEVVAVAESGVRHGDDARRLAAAGFQAVLVGESLLLSDDRRQAVRAMGGAPVGRRSLDRAPAGPVAG